MQLFARIPLAGLVLALLAGLAAAAAANPVPAYQHGWEGGSTVLGLYGSGDPPIIAQNVGSPEPVYEGSASLRLEDNSPSGTPQAYIAYLWNLRPGDVIMASLMRYDTTPGGAPSCRLWAHWNDELPDNPDGYSGSAGGNDDYGPGDGWSITDWSWTVPAEHSGLVLEVRTYSNPGDVVWIDDLEIVAPENAYIMFPDGTVGREARTWGGVKAMFR